MRITHYILACSLIFLSGCATTDSLSLNSNSDTEYYDQRIRYQNQDSWHRLDAAQQFQQTLANERFQRMQRENGERF